jgi:hypothetical protein
LEACAPRGLERAGIEEELTEKAQLELGGSIALTNE